MIQSVKLNKLVPSDINVRKTSEPVEQLAADIFARGILQNLVVTSVRKPRGAFAVIAGGRRLRALQLLAEAGNIDAAQYDVPVLVLAGDDATLSEASLAENFQHLAMNPADECSAFLYFLRNAGDIDGVAKRFGITSRFVEGRLRLAKLAEPIFTALAAGNITLDIAKAYASTESHDRQLLVWGQYGRHQHHNADSIRRVIANEAMSSDDPVALLVGADAYVGAGGTIDRDLFSDNADRWLAPEIAQNLAATIMEAEATRIGAEQGLAWIRPIAGTSTWESTRNLYRVRLPETPMTETDMARLAEISNLIDDVGDRMEDESLDEAEYTALADQVDQLEAEKTSIQRRPQIMPPALAAHVGTFLTLSHHGQMVLDNYYYSESPLKITMVEDDTAEDQGAQDEAGGDQAEATGEELTADGEQPEASDDGDATGEDQPAPPSGGRMTFRIEEDHDTARGGARTIGGKSAEVDPDSAAPGGKALSQVLADQLVMQRRDVLGAAIIANPALALDYMLFVMVDKDGRSAGTTGTTICAPTPQDPVLTSNMPSLRARDYLSQVHDGLDDSWTASNDKVIRFEAFRALGDDVKAAWLAYTVATSFVAKENYSTHRQNPLQNRLATILDIDVASWWRPTSENFFDRVPKTALLSLLDEVGGSGLSGRHASQKKSEISPSCEKLFAGEAIVEPAVRDAAISWVPAAMRFNDRAAAEGDQTGADEAAGSDDETAEQEPGDLDDLITNFGAGDHDHDHDHDHNHADVDDTGNDDTSGEFADDDSPLDAGRLTDDCANDDGYGELAAAE